MSPDFYHSFRILEVRRGKDSRSQKFPSYNPPTSIFTQTENQEDSGWELDYSLIQVTGTYVPYYTSFNGNQEG